MAQKITSPAQAFRSARIRAGLSFAELAERAGVSERTLRYIEAGNVEQPQMATARAVAEALSIPITDLVPEVAA